MTNEESLQKEIDAELAKLCDEYEIWNKSQGLALGSADEHLFDESLSEEQRAWVQNFSHRWEQAAPLYKNGKLTTRSREALEASE